jgi:ribosomal protein S6--L-glutamate ligase
VRLVSFDLLRSLGLPGVTLLKPEQMFAERDAIAAADWVLFPRSWQVGALAYGFRRPVFPSVATHLIGYDKVETTRAFEAIAPANVPHTLILPNEPEAAERALEEIGLPMVVKVPRAAGGAGVALLERRSELRSWCETCGDVLYAQEYLPVGQDLRVAVVGDRVVAAYWRRGGSDFRHNVARGGEIDPRGVPAEAVAAIERLALALGIDYGGFDAIWLDGHLWLLELNVYFGLRGVRDLGVELAPVILSYLERQGATPRPRRGGRGRRAA